MASSEGRNHRQSQGAEESQDAAFAKRGGCCCFWFPSARWERMKAAEEERWWTPPRWKAVKETFMWQFNRNRGGGRTNQGKFHYDPLSYSLNFDEGPGENAVLDEDVGYRDFSARYASIPASAKLSMDLGNDGPTFT